MKDSALQTISKIYRKFNLTDPILTVSVILLNTMGLVSLMCITEVTGDSEILLRQLAGSILGIILMTALSLADTEKITKYWKVYYAITIISLLAVLILGSSGGGAKRWINIAGLTFQPSELAKILLILFYSEFIIDMRGRFSGLITFALSTLLILPPFFMILKEPDLSTGIMILLIFCVIVFIAGIDLRVAVGMTAAAIPSAFMILYLSLADRIPFLGDYQRQRILAWLHPEEYASSTAYQTMNSMTAIGSGQLIGKGLRADPSGTLLGTGFISEPQTDFIFAVVGERFGFLGCCMMILLITLVTLCCYRIAAKSSNLRDRIIASSMAAWIGLQSYINIGVTTGLLPNTGIPLPFVSYGLTSLLCLYCGLGLVQNINMKRKSESAH